MYKMFGFLLLSLLYLEGVYHVAVFGLTAANPMLMIPAAIVVAAIETVLLGLSKKRTVNLVIIWVLLSVNFLIFASQVVYYKVFSQPLLIDVAVTTGGQALTDYWSVALEGIINSIIPLIFMAVPFVVAAVMLRMDILMLYKYPAKNFIAPACFTVLGVSLSALIIMINYNSETEFYEEYQGMYAPGDLAKNYGVLSLFERQFLGEALVELDDDIGNWVGNLPSGSENNETQSTEDGTEGTSETETETEEVPTIDTSPHVLNIDFDKLLANGNDDVDDLVEIMQAITPTNKNEYTGMFEGYNLIYITAEAFSPYCVSEEITPTLYKLVNNGVVVEDYYVPIWATSTTDGEYVNLFGQIPDGQNSFKKSAGYNTSSKKYTNEPNSYPYSLPAYFAAEGVTSYAYHNHSLSYYDRYITHPNLGYIFKAAKLGACDDSLSNMIFEMEHPGYWPESDYEMMVATIPEWIDDERFNVHYMTVSGHTNYNFTGNKMAKLNQDVVADLPYSEAMKAYIACNYELEKAMTYLVEELEKAGKLESTVIVLSADHYPYGLSDNKSEVLKYYEEVTGVEMSGFDLYKNCLIMWNSEMENIVVEKTCSSLDIMPTILNLFGFEYDSRLFPGNDMLSDTPSLVVFQGRSFMTDEFIYDASTKKVTSRTGEEISDDYVDAMKSYVKTLFKYSAGILNENFHEEVHEAQITESTTE